MKPALFVIDDFLADPWRFREAALELDYGGIGKFPGRNSVQHLHIQGLERLVESYVHEPVKPPSPPQSHGRFRLTMAADPAEALIHIDPSHWSGILYLSRPEDCRGGTEFFRHKPTNTDRVPDTIEGLNAIGYDSYDRFKAEVVDGDAHDRSKWESTMVVPMRFNRLVLLQPHYWHTSGPGFGATPEDARLVYLMFFYRRSAR